MCVVLLFLNSLYLALLIVIKTLYRLFFSRIVGTTRQEIVANAAKRVTMETQLGGHAESALVHSASPQTGGRQ